MGRRRWAGAIAVATTCAFIGAAGGIATSGAAGTSSTTSKAATTAKAAANGTDRHRGGPDGGPSVHSVSEQLNKAGTAFIEVTRDEGTVTAISGSDITLHEGTATVTYKDVTVTVPAGATVTRNDATAALTTIKVGDRVEISSSTEATSVRAYDPTFKPTRPAFGRGGHDGGFGGGFGGPDDNGPTSNGATTTAPITP